MNNNDKKELAKQQYIELALNSNSLKEKPIYYGTHPATSSKKAH